MSAKRKATAIMQHHKVSPYSCIRARERAHVRTPHTLESPRDISVPCARCRVSLAVNGDERGGLAEFDARETLFSDYRRGGLRYGKELRTSDETISRRGFKVEAPRASTSRDARDTRLAQSADEN